MKTVLALVAVLVLFHRTEGLHLIEIYLSNSSESTNGASISKSLQLCCVFGYARCIELTISFEVAFALFQGAVNCPPAPSVPFGSLSCYEINLGSDDSTYVKRCHVRCDRGYLPSVRAELATECALDGLTGLAEWSTDNLR